MYLGIDGFCFFVFFWRGLLLLEGMVWVWWHNPFWSLSAISERFRDYQDVNLDVLVKLIEKEKMDKEELKIGLVLWRKKHLSIRQGTFYKVLT